MSASKKLQKVFGAAAPVVPERLYGSIAGGTARKLYQPTTTHPGDHFSTVAIGDAVGWFAATLDCGTPRPVNDQIWYWKEAGTGIGLVGFIMIMLGTFDALVRLPLFAAICGEAIPAADQRDRHWWQVFAFNTMLPALLFFPTFIAAALVLPASRWLPQAVTTQTTLWAVVGAVVTLLIGRFMRRPVDYRQPDWLKSIMLAGATVAAGYAALWLVDQLFLTDFRLWVVAVKLPSVHQWAIAVIYVVPITFAFLITAKVLAGLTVRTDPAGLQYIASIMTLTSGFLVMLGVIYGLFFLSGSLVTAFDPLSTVIALRFVPVLAAVAFIATFTWRRSGSYHVGGLVSGLLVTLYLVAGTATQV